MTSAHIGIDLGTTFSLVSVLKDGRPVILPNANGELLTPSVVSLLEDDTIVVGSGATGGLAAKAWVFELRCFGHFGPLAPAMEGRVDFYHTNFSRRSHPRHPEFLPLSRMSKS